MSDWSIKIVSHITHRRYLRDILDIIRGDQPLSEYIDATFEDSLGDIPDAIYLHSQIINNNAKNDKDAFFRLNSLCLMLNGLISLFFDNFYKLNKNEVSLHLNLKNDEKEIYIEDEIEYLYPLLDKNILDNTEYNNHILNIVKISIQHRDIFEILMQLGFEDSWSRLYSIWDSIKTQSKQNLSEKQKVIDYLNLDKSDKKLVNKFTCSANSYSLLFLEARHGELYDCDKKNRITKKEAKNLIRKIILKYISKKYDFTDLSCEEQRKIEDKNKVRIKAEDLFPHEN